MISDYRDFDLMSRGLLQVTAQWKADHSWVGVVWQLQDVVEVFNDLFPRAFAIFDRYCAGDSLPYTFDHLSQTIQAMTSTADEVVLECDKIAAQHKLNGVDSLKAHLVRAQAILDEDSFATDMAFLNFREEKQE